MALSFYVLTGFLRREKRSNEAALKYVLLGAFSSGILAYGFSILYGLSGATNIGAITAALAAARQIGARRCAQPSPWRAGRTNAAAIAEESTHSAELRSLRSAASSDSRIRSGCGRIVFSKSPLRRFISGRRMFTKARQRRLPLMSAWLRRRRVLLCFCGFSSPSFLLRKKFPGTMDCTSSRAWPWRRLPGATSPR